MSESNSPVISTTDDTFEADVVVRSQLGLVLVDFWADWCAPCRMLSPILENLAEEYKDRLTLVKADTEQNPAASQTFGVSGIPAVFAVFNGETIDGFQGALPEPAIRSWIESCLATTQLLRLKQLTETDPESAESSLRELIESGEYVDQAKGLLLQALHAQGKAEDCKELLADLQSRGFLEPEYEKIQSELALQGKSDFDLDQLRKKADQDPNDYSVQFELAEALASQQQYESAMEICLKLVEEDRAVTGEQARLLMLDVFRVEGDDSELTREYRRKLSMLLY